VSLALRAADAIQAPLALPDAAFTYLRSHGTLDQAHTASFALLMDQIEEADDRQAIVHAARAFYRLYGEVFRSLPLPQGAGAVIGAGVGEPAEAAARAGAGRAGDRRRDGRPTRRRSGSGALGDSAPLGDRGFTGRRLAAADRHPRRHPQG
jgi:hypothetical protein